MAQQQIVMTPAQLQQLLGAIGGGGGGGQGREKRLPPFTSANAKDWITWKNTFENVATLKQWGDQEKKLQLIAAMEGKAQTSVATVQVGPMNADQVMQAYSNRFLPPQAGAQAREEFKQAAQRVDESLMEWHSRLSELFSRAHPNDDKETDIRLIERFIRGMNHGVIMDRTNDANPQNMTDALQVATTKLAGIQMVKQATLENKQRNYMASIAPLTQPPEGTSAGEGGAEAQAGVAALHTECFHCKRKGHYRSECPLRSVPREEAVKKAGGQGGRGRFRQTYNRSSNNSGFRSVRGSRPGRGRGRGGNNSRRLPRRTDERTIQALADAVVEAFNLDDEIEGEGAGN